MVMYMYVYIYMYKEEYSAKKDIKYLLEGYR